MTAALILLAVQGFLGAFDTLRYHERYAHLPTASGARLELRLHATRDFLYAVIFCTLGWIEWKEFSPGFSLAYSRPRSASHCGTSSRKTCGGGFRLASE